MFKFVTQVQEPEHGSWQSLIQVVYDSDRSVINLSEENQLELKISILIESYDEKTAEYYWNCYDAK